MFRWKIPQSFLEPHGARSLTTHDGAECCAGAGRARIDTFTVGDQCKPSTTYNNTRPYTLDEFCSIKKDNIMKGAIIDKIFRYVNQSQAIDWKVGRFYAPT